MDLRRLRFRVSSEGRGGIGVLCSLDDGPPVVPFPTPFQANLKDDGRLAGIIARIENDTCTIDDLRELGSELWGSLLGGEIGNAVEPIVAEARSKEDILLQIRLELPPELEHIPWETLYDIDVASFLSTEPGCSVVRDPLSDQFRLGRQRAPRDGFRMLTIIPEGSGLRVEQELGNLNRVVKDVENLEFLDLRGRVTPDRISDRLGEIQPDIFHFIGHGELDSAGRVTIRLNSDDGGELEFWTQAEQFCVTLARAPIRIAVFNCCYAGHSERTSLSGLGPLLLKRGVPAIVAMRYPIADRAALRFSEAFYGALLTGEHHGRVDLALQHARSVLYRNATRDQWRSFITPVLYLAQGYEKTLNTTPRSPATAIKRVEQTETSPLPAELISAFKLKRCIPIVGSGLLEPPSDRLTTVRYTLRALTEHLSQQCKWYDSALLQAAESARLEDLAFQSVAEVFVHEKQLFSLIDALRVWHEKVEPNALHLALARWHVPAIFYTHFDGLLEAAYQRCERSPQVVYKISEPPNLQQGHHALILVRGTLNDDKSLVLTEQENEELCATIDRLSPAIEQIATAYNGRSLVLLGVSPRDAAVRRLARRLIRPRTNQGPAFFVYPNVTASDRAFWQAFNVVWIEAQPNAVIQTLTQTLSV